MSILVRNLFRGEGKESSALLLLFQICSKGERDALNPKHRARSIKYFYCLEPLARSLLFSWNFAISTLSKIFRLVLFSCMCPIIKHTCCTCIWGCNPPWILVTLPVCRDYSVLRTLNTVIWNLKNSTEYSKYFVFGTQCLHSRGKNAKPKAIIQQFYCSF